MQSILESLSKKTVLLTGLAFTSRTETVEDYLKSRVRSLAVIAISSCFLKENLSSCRVYESGQLVKEFKIANFRIKDYKWYRQPLVIPVFIVNWFSVCHCILRLKKKYDIYFGISHSFGLWGALLKKFGVARKLIYYCIDYYFPDKKFSFNSLFVKFLNMLDRFTVKTADCIWDLSPKIQEYREKERKTEKGSHKSCVVPLGYGRHLRRSKPFSEIRRWDIGFVGSISGNQGLQLLVDAMPDVIKEFPGVSATIIGEGPYLDDLKKMVTGNKLGKYFNFLGFIRDEDKMLDILSGSAISIALYTDSDGNARCADTGKPKLYALLGLPIITTPAYIYSQEVAGSCGGIVVDYKKDAVAKAISFLLADDARLKEFRDNSYRFGEQFISDNIFDQAISNMEHL